MTKKCSEQEVITALMASATLTEAAELLGVSRQTVYNYMGEAGFDEKLKEAQEARDKELKRIRETASVEALGCLVDIVKGESGIWTTSHDRIEAAKVILTYGSQNKQKN